MARPRKPTAVKKLQGTLQKCRTPVAEPQPQVDLKGALPPDYLSESAREIWQFSLEQLPDGMLSTVDYAAFCQWVVCFDQFVILTAAIKKEGTIQETEDGQLQVSGLLHHLTKTAAILRGLENELGFTPAARSRVTSFKAAATGEKNKFEEL